MSADPRHPFEVSHGVISYPFPLSDGRFALLLLPERLDAGDAERLTEYIAALAAAGGAEGDTPA